MRNNTHSLDVLCLGHASYDLVFSVPHHPGADEKIVADGLLGCGGGPAANAALCIAKLGFKSGFCGFLGNDVYGDSHLQELLACAVDTRYIVRGDTPTPVSAVLVKPDGKRALVNYRGETQALPAGGVDFAGVEPKAVLFDGHEPHLSLSLLAQIKGKAIPAILDAGSLHAGTLALLDKIDYLAASEKFALQYAADENAALSALSERAPVAIITLGERGLIWKRGPERGSLPAPPVSAIDTTGAGDAFHGALAAGVAAGMEWHELLRYASAAGAFCCTQLGARPGLPNRRQVQNILDNWPSPVVSQIETDE